MWWVLYLIHSIAFGRRLSLVASSRVGASNTALKVMMGHNLEVMMGHKKGLVALAASLFVGILIVARIVAVRDT